MTEFLGCFSRNQLTPFPETFYKSMIINTGHSSGPIIYWVAMILLAEKCLYFKPLWCEYSRDGDIGLCTISISFFCLFQYLYSACESNKCKAFCVSIYIKLHVKLCEVK